MATDFSRSPTYVPMSFTEPISDDPAALRSRAKAALAAAQAEREAFATGTGGSPDEVVAAFDRIVAPLDGRAQPAPFRRHAQRGG